ncbi:MAG: response regulator [Woeseiaceae bacterium]|nr:response regulator [Woeseiaceae bacterium]
MRRVRVLLADDHRLVAEALQKLLEPEFELIGIVADGFALLDVAAEKKPDVIVTDISMPGLNGIEALEELKKKNPDVHVVCLTMHRELAYARRALDAGALGYVLKHSAPEELVMAVRAAAEGRTFITPAIAGEVLQSIQSGDVATADPVRKLTLRQREILRLLADGHSAKKIAKRLKISPRTVEFHKYTMMDTLGVSTSAELIRFALKNHVADG